MASSLLGLPLLLLLENALCSPECFPSCARSPLPNCANLLLCFDCGHPRSVWTFNGGALPPNVCVNDGKLWAEDEDVSSALNCGLYQCSYDSAQTVPIRKVFNFSSVKDVGHSFAKNGDYRIRCPVKLCATSFSWSFARRAGERFGALPPNVSPEMDSIRISNMTKRLEGIYECAITSRVSSLRRMKRRVTVKQADRGPTPDIPDGYSVRFTNCERSRCAPSPGAEQHYTCEGRLRDLPPTYASIYLSCGRLGSVEIFILSFQNASKENGSLSLRHHPEGRHDFVVTASVSNVMERDRGIRCTLTAADSFGRRDRVFSLCVDEQTDLAKKSWTLIGSSCAAVLVFLFLFLIVFYFQFELLFLFRRLKYAWHHVEVMNFDVPQLVILYGEHKKRDAASLASDLLRSFGCVTCRLYREGLPGQEIGDNAQDVIRSASLLIVLMDRKAFEDEAFTHALNLSFELPALTRIYIWRTDVTANYIKRNVNVRLGANLRTDMHPIWHRKRYISWARDGVLPKKQLVAKLRLVLPMWAVFSSSS